MGNELDRLRAALVDRYRLAARAAFDSARGVVDARLAQRPDDWQARSARGLILAGLGEREAALAEVARLKRHPMYQGGYLEAQALEDRARILAQVGEAGAAIDEIERLLERPSWVSVHTLRLDPIWDPIRDHPRFRAAVAKHSPR